MGTLVFIDEGYYIALVENLSSRLFTYANIDWKIEYFPLDAAGTTDSMPAASDGHFTRKHTREIGHFVVVLFWVHRYTRPYEIRRDVADRCRASAGLLLSAPSFLF